MYSYVSTAVVCRKTGERSPDKLYNPASNPTLQVGSFVKLQMQVRPATAPWVELYFSPTGYNEFVAWLGFDPINNGYVAYESQFQFICDKTQERDFPINRTDNQGTMADGWAWMQLSIPGGGFGQFVLSPTAYSDFITWLGRDPTTDPPP